MCAYKPSQLELLVDPLLEMTILRPRYIDLIRYMGLKGSERVLDFGSGPGVISGMIAKELEKGGGRVSCLDVTKEWLDQAKRRLRRRLNVEFIFGDIRTQKIPKSSFDAVVVHYVIHDIEKGDRKEIISALADILASGGRLHIREPISKSHGMPADELRTLLKESGLEETRVSIGKRRVTATLTKK